MVRFSIIKWSIFHLTNTVENYSIENNKLIVDIKELNEKHIIYQENNKLYCTIENAEGTNFPIEMKKVNDEDEVSIIG